MVPDRFRDYVNADPAESARIQFEEIPSDSGFFRQINFGEESAPIDFMTWQENELMLAELELVSDNASALARVNAVRASHDIGSLAALDQTALLQEREKELFVRGARLADQRRFGLFHLPGKWQYLPITNEERNANDNIN